ncbi:transcriptional regulator family: Fungal Specific TF [Aspergillus niger]|nr:transcriptional regulator family: Fungal Specific TF [Aspergillus niger]KAI3004441.1 transcriptional regulator family: Fungal Specific TF [Aspergillus niger]KAI3054996.1 transcriptional regulator family: Fungal Specific TF [Aspergillus niger]
MAVIYGLPTVASTVAAACAIIAIILGALSWSRTASLYLPLPEWVPAIATIFPPLTALALYLASRLAQPADDRQSSSPWRRLLPVMNHLQSIITTIIATVALAYLYPESITTCRLEQEWQSYFRAKDAQPIRAIQDEFRCCGFRSIHDRAWPFKDKTTGDDACEVQFNYGTSCLVPWRQQQQSASWMVFVAAVLTLLMKVALYQAMRQRPSWMTMQFGRQARSQQYITPAALEDEDANDDAEGGRRGAFLPRAGPRLDNEWNDRDKATIQAIGALAWDAPLPIGSARNLTLNHSTERQSWRCYNVVNPAMGSKTLGLRKYSPRSRTGCRTCRTRRIKCDETPGPACKNCTSTGRTCDRSPVFQLPVKTRLRHASLLHTHISTNVPGMTTDERRCLALFQTYTMPMLIGVCDSELWQRLVLQMSQTEPAVGHAVAALGAFHETTTGSVTGTEVVGGNNDYRLFALEQYGRAIAVLRRRLASGSGDPQLRVTALVCCVIFVVIEFLQDNYREVLVHLKNGTYILMNQTGPRAREAMFKAISAGTNDGSKPEEDAVFMQMFAQLTVQAAHFNNDSVMRLQPSDTHLSSVQYDKLEIRSLREAKERLDPLIDSMVRFWTRCETELRDRSADHRPLYVEQQQQYSNMQRHINAFETYVAQAQYFTPKEVRAIDTIRVSHIVMSTYIATFLDLSETIYDRYLAGWSRAVTLAEQIVASLQAEYAHKQQPLPNVISDIGVFVPLFSVGIKCRNVGIRERVLKLFRAWPHREGLHDSMSYLYMVREIAKMEREAADADGSKDGTLRRKNQAAVDRLAVRTPEPAGPHGATAATAPYQQHSRDELRHELYYLIIGSPCLVTAPPQLWDAPEGCETDAVGNDCRPRGIRAEILRVKEHFEGIIRLQAHPLAIGQTDKTNEQQQTQPRNSDYGQLAGPMFHV